ncbi:MAG TPA: extracellular solute-binding protein [Armatimonadota bacterium]|jgi:ABC-type glycerol-3-phosphate transport system substrate-binding protein
MSQLRLPLALSLVAVLLAAGSAGSAETPAEPTHLEIAVWYDGAASDLGPLNDLTWSFQQRHPSVVVSLRRRATLTAYPLLQQWALDPASAPDLTVISSTWLPQFQASFASLDAAAQSDAGRKITPSVWSLFTTGGQVKAVPWGVAARVLLIRSDLLQAKHLQAPENWDQVLALLPGLSSPPQVYAIGLPGARAGGGAALLQEMIWAEGDSLVGAEGAVDLTAPAKLKALTNFCALAHAAQPEVLSWTQNELESAFAAGRVGMVFSDTWAARGLKGATGVPAYQVLPLPRGASEAQHIMGDGLAVMAKGKSVALATEFAQFILTASAQEKLVAWGGLPVQQDLVKKSADPLLTTLLPTLTTARLSPPGQPVALANALDYAIYLAVSGRSAPAEALAAAEEMLRGTVTPPATGAPTGVEK